MYSGKYIAVVGGTGKIGTSVVKQLLLSGYDIKLLTRNISNLSVFSDKITVVEGDAREYLSLLRLTEECSAIINCISSENKNKPIHSIVTKNILKAIDNFGVRRFITITGTSINVPGDKKSIKTKVSSKILRIVYPNVINDKQKEFDLVSHSKTNWTFVRSPLVSDKCKFDKIKISTVDNPGNSIKPDTLAKFIVSIINTNKYVHKAPFISN